jgi:hypothetical protein
MQFSNISLLDTNAAIAPVFKYHQICRNDTQRLCFHDEDYICICEEGHGRAVCFGFNSKLDHCSKCFSEGKCIQGNLKVPNDFICLCRSCHQGHHCEFNMKAFSFTLDSLLVSFSKEVKIIYLSAACLLFFIGFFNNLCSFVTFKRPTPRRFGAGNYLLMVTCHNQIALFCLLFKFIQITVESSDIGSCKGVSYSLSTFTRSTYWLTSWVSVDRLLIIIFPTSITLKNPRLAICLSFTTWIILCVMHVHESIYYTIIQHTPTGFPVCVTNFNNHLISTYNRISTLIHYLFPFFVQVVAITLLIVLAARSRAKTIEHNISFKQVLQKQFRNQKELFITPIVIIFSALPQTILTFSLACMQLSSWQRHLLLLGCLLSYIPQVFSFILYVLPSTTYKKEFSETLIAKKFFKWIITKEKNGIVKRRNKRN